MLYVKPGMDLLKMTTHARTNKLDKTKKTVSKYNLIYEAKQTRETEYEKLVAHT